MSRLVLVIVLLFSANLLHAEEVEVVENDVKGLSIDKQYIDGWGITPEEYERFKFLKDKTPRGVYTPENPIIYLGLEARSDEERMKYAKRIVQIEWENQQKVEKFSKAWQEAVVLLYGHGNIIDLNKADEFKERLKDLAYKKAGGMSGSDVDKKVFISSFGCVECVEQYQRLSSEVESNRLDRVVVVFPKNMTNQEIKLWAKAQKVSKVLNEQGRIVLRYVKPDENPLLFNTSAN